MLSLCYKNSQLAPLTFVRVALLLVFVSVADAYGLLCVQARKKPYASRPGDIIKKPAVELHDRLCTWFYRLQVKRSCPYSLRIVSTQMRPWCIAQGFQKLIGKQHWSHNGTHGLFSFLFDGVIISSIFQAVKSTCGIKTPPRKKLSFWLCDDHIKLFGPNKLEI